MSINQIMCNNKSNYAQLHKNTITVCFYFTYKILADNNRFSDLWQLSNTFNKSLCWSCASSTQTLFKSSRFLFQGYKRSFSSFPIEFRASDCGWVFLTALLAVSLTVFLRVLSCWNMQFNLHQPDVFYHLHCFCKFVYSCFCQWIVPVLKNIYKLSSSLLQASQLLRSFRGNTQCLFTSKQCVYYAI